jgi:hypothetical protein
VKISIWVSRKDDGGAESEEQRQAMVAALEFLFGQRDTWSIVESPVPFGWKLERMQFETDPQPGSSMYEWRRVALSKWRHFKEMWSAYEGARGYGNSQVALDVHAYSLAKMVPYLLGVPDEAIDSPTAISRSERARLTRGGRGEVDAEAGKFARVARPGDPHHHEERMPAYPSEGLEFIGSGHLYAKPIPDAFEQPDERGPVGAHEPGPQCGPDCGI